jgi:hypothetical protein
MTKYPALSRVDNKTHICSECGTDEALLDFARVPLTMDNWHKPKSAPVKDASPFRYYPFVLKDTDGFFGGGEILVSVYMDSDGKPTAEIARRDDFVQRWSPPSRLEPR